MHTTFILLNGPPGSGKSTIAPMFAYRLQKNGFTVHRDSFAAPMKHYIASLLNEQYAEMDKDKARPELNGYSVRQFLISQSEDHMKPRYGKDIYARLLVHRCLRSPAPQYVISDDCGFEVERAAVPHNVIIHVKRDGHDFSNDSRSFLPNPDYTIENNYTMEALRRICDTYAGRIIQRKT